MKPIKSSLIIAFTILFSSVAHTTVTAADPYFSVGLGMDYVRGDFGTETTTESITLPLIVDFFPSPRTDIEITFPYVLHSDNKGFIGTSMPYRYHYMEGRSYVKGANTAPVMMGNGNGSTANGQAAEDDDEKNTSVSGLGDITFTAGYIFLEEADLLPQMKTKVFLKAPTSDKNNGLGTDEFDAGPGLAMSKWFGDWNISAEGMYIFCGESDLYPAKDYASYIISLGYTITEKIFCSLSGNGGTSSVEGGTAPFEARLRLNLKSDKGTGLEAYAGKGLTDGSPDYAAGLAIFQDF